MVMFPFQLGKILCCSLITSQHKKPNRKTTILFCMCGSSLIGLAIFDLVAQNTYMVITCIVYFHAVSNYALKACAACYFHNSIKKIIFWGGFRIFMPVWCILLFKCAACQTRLVHLWFPLQFSEIVLLTSCRFFAILGWCITLLYIYQKAISGIILMMFRVIQSDHEACTHQMRSNHCWSGRQKPSTHAHLERPSFSSGLEIAP